MLLIGRGIIAGRVPAVMPQVSTGGCVSKLYVNIKKQAGSTINRVWVLALSSHQLLLPTLVSDWDVSWCFDQLLPWVLISPGAVWVFLGEVLQHTLKPEAGATPGCLEAACTSGHVPPAAA